MMKFLAVITLLVAGCVHVGPEYHRPNIDIPPRFEGSRPLKSPLKGSGMWWRDFHDGKLDRLIDQAINNNLDIKASAFRIVQMHYQLIQARSQRLPRLDLNGRAAKTRETFGITLPSIYRKRSTVDTYNLAAAASFELDIWGRIASLNESAREQFLEARDTRNSVINSIIAETAALYFQEQALLQRIDLAKAIIDDQKNTLRITEERYNRGITGILELKNASTELKRLESRLTTLVQELNTTRQKICVLLGKYPSTRQKVSVCQLPYDFPSAGHTGKQTSLNISSYIKDHTFDYVDRMSPVPSGIPSELLERRPDIRAAEARLKSINAQVGVAKAARFPSIKLTSTYGYISDSFRELIRPDSMLSEMAMGITQPIFNAGALKAEQRAMEAQYKQVQMDYAKTVLNAFFEVENALMTEHKLLERRKDIVKIKGNTASTLSIIESRYSGGLVEYTKVLGARKAYLDILDELSNVDLAILTNRVSLYRALGGVSLEQIDKKQDD